MCGRYYVDDDTAREIEKLVRQVNERVKAAGGESTINLKSGDIHPTDKAPVLTARQLGIGCEWQKWGFPFPGKGVTFNARSETALTKPMFRESILSRRAVAPAAHFYEWNQQKEKFTFYKKGQPVLYLAGCFHYFNGKKHFVILTTQANSSMLPVHDRMPLVLDREEAADWILDASKTEEYLSKKSCLLDRRTDYEQISFF